MISAPTGLGNVTKSDGFVTKSILWVVENYEKGGAVSKKVEKKGRMSYNGGSHGQG